MINPPPIEIPPLTRLYFYLTEGCNMACRHCWLSPRLDTDGTKHPVLPMELFAQAIREAKPLGLTGVKLTGGDPLLHPRFTDILAIVRREELELIIETNGLLCTPAMAKEIAKSTDRFVSVSIDGADAATHEAIRGVPGSFDAACRAVRALAGTDTPTQIISTIMVNNIGQVEDIVDLAEELGASSVKFNSLQPMGRGEGIHRGNGAVGVAQLLEIGREVETQIAPAVNIPISFDTPPAFSPMSRIASGAAGDTCGITTTLGVLAAGKYALCGIGEQIPELVFGTIGEDALACLWENNPTLKELREGMPDRLEGICARCLMKHRCLGSCVAQNYYQTKSFWSPYWLCKEAEQEGLFPESRTVPASA